MELSKILKPRCVVLDLTGATKEEVLRRLSAPVSENRPEIDSDKLVGVLLKREQASSTAIADAIAIPHGKVPLDEEVIAAFGRSIDGLDFEALDGQPTKIFFLLVSPESHPSLHLRWLAHIASLLKNPEFRARLLAAADAGEILASIEQEEKAQKREP